jgi:hypothetical protein
MKFLVVSTNTKDVSPFVAAEAERLAELRAAGTLTAGWVKADYSGGILLLECVDQAEANTVLNTPAARGAGDHYLAGPGSPVLCFRGHLTCALQAQSRP